MKLYFDSLTTLEVIHAESSIVIFFGTYGIINSTLGATARALSLIHTQPYKEGAKQLAKSGNLNTIWFNPVSLKLRDRKNILYRINNSGTQDRLSQEKHLMKGGGRDLARD